MECTDDDDLSGLDPHGKLVFSSRVEEVVRAALTEHLGCGNGQFYLTDGSDGQPK